MLTVLLRRLAAIGIGIFTGIAVGWLLSDGNYVGLAAGLLYASLVFVVVRVLTPMPARLDLYLLVGLALTLRYAVAVTLHNGLVAAGRGGFVTGDDANYADLSWALAQVIQGKTVDFDFETQGYLLGTFVYLETAIFLLLGPNVVVVELLNAALGAILAVLAFDLTRRMFADDRASLVAAALTAFFPSIVLWTSLNLKESLTLVLIAVMLWLLVVFERSPTAWLLVAMYVPLLLMQSLRFYVFVGLAIVLPIGVALASVATRSRRLVLSSVAVAFSIILLLYEFTASAQFEAGLLGRLEQVRGAMAVGARTGFGAPVIRVYDGATYVVSSSTAITVPPDRTPRVVTVQPSTRLVVGTPAPGRDAISVLPGDTVVIGPPGTTPAPSPQQMRLAGEVDLIGANDDTLVLRTFAYLPIGAAFALFAPVPGSGTRLQDLLPIPEMLLWYGMLVGAAFSVWRWRQRWRTLLPTVLFIGGTMTIFTLAEGNVGTLYRHRAMVIPFVAMLASPAFALLLFGRGRWSLPVLRVRPRDDHTRV
jgi:hypothetical protein